MGGQYAYLRDAWGPMPAFLYGWSLLLVIQSGGMAAVAITFARYFVELTHLPLAERRGRRRRRWLLLTAINCLGVRAGSNVQSVLMVLKIGAIVALVLCGLLLAPARMPARPRAAAVEPVGRSALIGAALTPVMFAYGGWQTASFVAGEMRDPRRDLARGLLLGVIGVVAALHRRRLHLRPRARAAGAGRDARRRRRAVMRLALGEHRRRP